MTMIKKIEELNCLDRLDYSESESKAFYNAKHKVLEILRAETVIKAKGVRKRGTDRFCRFYDNLDQWIADDFVFMFYDKNIVKEHFGIVLPPDAELVDIEIHIPE